MYMSAYSLEVCHKMEEAYDINTATDLYNIVKIGLNEVKQ